MVDPANINDPGGDGDRRQRRQSDGVTRVVLLFENAAAAEDLDPVPLEVQVTVGGEVVTISAAAPEVTTVSANNYQAPSSTPTSSTPTRGKKSKKAKKAKKAKGSKNKHDSAGGKKSKKGNGRSLVQRANGASAKAGASVAVAAMLVAVGFFAAHRRTASGTGAPHHAPTLTEQDAVLATEPGEPATLATAPAAGEPATRAAEEWHPLLAAQAMLA